ncbi:methyl-accepting chemotaxis protein [Lachnobacterium bovis]|uniref:Methyl-accepting chemotaxis protein n=1 Tax=Lachnobacterium bovis TaxID=140626 RepID=A0A1H9TAJ4_9FIRM|nr:methyl-accepting chemotaxis protein [Lachnobacterium bovis]SER94171.1 methyl-accepting chemotaxis protein [Lachnobacterium bovis]
MKKRGSLKVTIIMVVVLSVLITAVVIDVFSINKIIATNKRQTASYRERLMDDQKISLKDEVQIVISYIEQVYKKQQEGKITEEQAKKQCADYVRNMKYSDGEGYFWIDTAEGVNIVLQGRDMEGKDRSGLVDPNGVKYVQEILNAGKKEGGGYAYYSFAKKDDGEPLPKMSYSVEFKPYNWVIGTGVWIDHIDELEKAYVEEAGKSLKNNLIQSGLILLILIILGSVFAVYFGKRLIDPIIMITHQMLLMSNSDFRKNEELEKIEKIKKHNNEVGQIADALDIMHGNIRNLMIKISETTDYLASTAQHLSANAIQSAEASDMVAESCTSVADSCTNQITSVTDTGSQTQQLVENMHSFEEAIVNTANLVKNTNESAAKGANDMNNATDMMKTIKESVESTSVVVEGLGEKLKNIDTFVDTIAGIATQTNLLSLNASIEAARAGEMGKGFAVVASEISQLAEQSNQAASSITELINDIMKQSEEAVDSMKNGAKNVMEGSEVVDEAGATFNNIHDMVLSISEQSDKMSQIVVEISNSTDSIEDNIKKIEEMSKNISDETHTVSAASEEQAASTHEVAGASEKLASNAQELQDFVSKFDF